MSESLDLAEGAWYTKEDFLDLYFHDSSADDGRGQVTKARRCVYVCAREKERGREGEREGGGERASEREREKGEGEGEGDSVCVWEGCGRVRMLACMRWSGG